MSPCTTQVKRLNKYFILAPIPGSPSSALFARLGLHLRRRKSFRFLNLGLGFGTLSYPSWASEYHRLVGWYLDPLIPKHDISKSFQETMARPFLCFNKEWRDIILSLVLLPTMLVEIKALLHSKFLVTKVPD
ncbi:putative Acyl-CoA synthetase family member 4 [Quillaja saponaria]|uniref:Acyl-CoA synthetase family member 4 n=1 Tax=Quillaja saponaria TaxID=32244 RepID=A0AAD7PHK2_QUISA|nr:putative Acyl-CoA synthetase family member 4 [Quillaja saponaria]